MAPSRGLLLTTFAFCCVLAFQGFAEYSTFDGSNNNLIHPRWGAAGEIYLRGDGNRTHIPNYIDGRHQPPTELPSARLISNKLIGQNPEKISSWPISALHIYMGQFIDHDITHTPMTTDNKFPIPIPADDPMKSRFGLLTTEMPFSRSATQVAPCSCHMEQVNTVSAFLDLSQVYGPTETMAKHLRVTPSSCKLKVRPTLAGDLLPTNVAGFPVDNDSRKMPHHRLRVSGDERVNQNAGLYSLTVLFIREHNRLCDHFANITPDATEEQRFQEARRWNIAYYQRIVFDEYIPSTTGRPLSRYTGYSASINPTIDGFFASVGFRYGHSEVLSHLPRLNEQRKEIPQKNLSLADMWFDPSKWENEGIEPVLIGLASESQNDVDPFYVDELRNFLFAGPENASVMAVDLAARNIQRARDHGMPSYNDAREYFGLARVSEFAEISSLPMTWSVLKSLYGSVDKIDAYVGALGEDHFDIDEPIGPLFKASVEEQYLRLREGDRFYYENIEVTKFNETELGVIQRTRLADIITRNTKVGKIQCSTMFVPRGSLPYGCGPNKDVPSPASNGRLEVMGGFMIFNWTVDLKTQEISISLTARTGGWVGVGIAADPDSGMLGSDAIIGYVDDQNGEVHIQDYQISARLAGCPGVCPDTKLGGKNNVLDPSGSQVADGASGVSITTISFRRKLDTGDPFDHAIKPGNTPMVFAAGSRDELSYHGENKMATTVELVPAPV